MNQGFYKFLGTLFVVPSANGTTSGGLVNDNTAHSFEIEVKPFHMLRYAHGVVSVS